MKSEEEIRQQIEYTKKDLKDLGDFYEVEYELSGELRALNWVLGSSKAEKLK